MAEMNIAAFTMGDREHFETLAHLPIQPTYRDLLRDLLPVTWMVSRFDVWLSAHAPNVESPGQGFKIHVSATDEDAKSVVRLVAERCVAAKTSFKVAADPRFHRYLSSKRCGRGNAGKFMTLYPADLASCQHLLEALFSELADIRGAYILSDRPYRGSRSVFYRYGGFTSRKLLQLDGTRSSMIVGSDGALRADERLPYFRLPDNVDDPFYVEEVDAEDDSPVLDGRFEITNALTYSNAGGVYKGIDRTTGDTVVLKEARPHVYVTALKTGMVEAAEVLRNEYDMLCRLRDVAGVVKPIAFFKEWEHWFLVEEMAGGIPLTNFRAQESIILLRRMHDPHAVREFEAILSRIGTNLLDIVEQVHAAGVILGDLSPNNVLVETSTRAVRLIDVESASSVDSSERLNELAARLYTPGFRAGNTRKVEANDDLYAVGMILSSLVLAVEPFFELEPNAKMRFLDRFVSNGLAPEVRDVVAALSDGDVATARAGLAVLGENDE